ncbi:hypothetical protein L6R50_27340, partial [Myxococcota bacterium]|nr:hypothetical protein [Myxococcota bacterium]
REVSGVSTGARARAYWKYVPGTGLLPRLAVQFADDVPPEVGEETSHFTGPTWTVDGASGEVLDSWEFVAEASADGCVEAHSGFEDAYSFAVMPDADLDGFGTPGRLSGPWLTVFDERDFAPADGTGCYSTIAGDPALCWPFDICHQVPVYSTPRIGNDCGFGLLNVWRKSEDSGHPYAANAYRRISDFFSDYVERLTGVDFDTDVADADRLTVLVEARTGSGTSGGSSFTRLGNHCLRGQPVSGGPVTPHFFARPAILLSTSGASEDLVGGPGLADGRSRARGVTFHEATHYVDRFVFGHLGAPGDTWPFDASTPWMLGALDEGFAYYTSSAFISNHGDPTSINFVATHCAPVSGPQFDRYFLTRSGIWSCIDRTGDREYADLDGDGSVEETCPIRYGYDVPQFEVRSGINDLVRVRETYVPTGGGAPQTDDWTVNVLDPDGVPPFINVLYLDGEQLRGWVESALDFQGKCDFTVEWVDGAASHGVGLFPGVAGFAIRMADNPGEGCESVEGLEIYDLNVFRALLPTMGFVEQVSYSDPNAADGITIEWIPNQDGYLVGEYPNPILGDNGGTSYAYDGTWYRQADDACGGVDDENVLDNLNGPGDNKHFVGDWVTQSLWHARMVSGGCGVDAFDAAALAAMIDIAGLGDCPSPQDALPADKLWDTMDVCPSIFDRHFVPLLVTHLAQSCPARSPGYEAHVNALLAHDAYNP